MILPPADLPHESSVIISFRMPHLPWLSAVCWWLHATMRMWLLSPWMRWRFVNFYPHDHWLCRRLRTSVQLLSLVHTYYQKNKHKHKHKKAMGDKSNGAITNSRTSAASVSFCPCLRRCVASVNRDNATNMSCLNHASRWSLLAGLHVRRRHKHKYNAIPNVDAVPLC